MKIVSYNINGIRAANKKGLASWINAYNADIYCFQETRANELQILAELADVKGYNCYYSIAAKAGYSGTCVLTKAKPNNVYYLFDSVKNVDEGRTVICEFNDFVLVNLYTPNGGSRLEFKLEYMEKILKEIDNLIKKNLEVVICTDFNIAHTPLDLSNPKQCQHFTGYLPEERELFDRYLQIGLYDSFRQLNPTAQCFSWSSYSSKAMNNEVGNVYRFDYIFVTEKILKRAEAAHILYEENYSDHYPVTLELEL